MKRTLWLLPLLAVALLPRLNAQQAQELRGVGCIESAVDSQCLMLRDLATGSLYSLRLGSPGPSAGEAIEFTAIPQQGVNLCMQGQAVTVTRWVRSQGLRCAPGAHGDQASTQPAPSLIRPLPGYGFR